MKPKTIFLIVGRPGSGKTSTAREIDIENITHYSIGGMYRNISTEKSELAKIVKKHIDNGEIVPIDIAKNVINNFLEKGSKMIIIDGFPRSLKQAEMFNNLMQTDKYSLKKVIEIVADDEIAFKRISGRKRGIDDNKELFEHRMNIYNKDINKIRDYYEQKNIYTKINGNFQLEIVVENLKKILLSA